MYHTGYLFLYYNVVERSLFEMQGHNLRKEWLILERSHSFLVDKSKENVVNRKKESFMEFFGMVEVRMI